MTFGPLWRRLLDLNRRAPPRIGGAHGPGESAARELFAIWPRARAQSGENRSSWVSWGYETQ